MFKLLVSVSSKSFRTLGSLKQYNYDMTLFSYFILLERLSSVWHNSEIICINKKLNGYCSFSFCFFVCFFSSWWYFTSELFKTFLPKMFLNLFFFFLHRLQPNADTRQKQLEAWCSLALSYCRHHKLYTLDVMEAQESPMFNNKKIERILKLLYSHKCTRNSFWVNGENILWGGFRILSSRYEF